MHQILRCSPLSSNLQNQSIYLSTVWFPDSRFLRSIEFLNFPVIESDIVYALSPWGYIDPADRFVCNLCFLICGLCVWACGFTHEPRSAVAFTGSARSCVQCTLVPTGAEKAPTGTLSEGCHLFCLVSPPPSDPVQWTDQSIITNMWHEYISSKALQ